jgi:hypothetical protein
LINGNNVCSLMYMPNDGYCVKVGSHQPLGYDYFFTCIH